MQYIKFIVFFFAFHNLLNLAASWNAKYIYGAYKVLANCGNSNCQDLSASSVFLNSGWKYAKSQCGANNARLAAIFNTRDYEAIKSNLVVYGDACYWTAARESETTTLVWKDDKSRYVNSVMRVYFGEKYDFQFCGALVVKGREVTFKVMHCSEKNCRALCRDGLTYVAAVARSPRWDPFIHDYDSDRWSYDKQYQYQYYKK